MVRKVDDEEHMCDLVLVTSSLEVMDAVAGTGYEVSYLMTRVALDDYQSFIIITTELKQWAVKMSQLTGLQIYSCCLYSPYFTGEVQLCIKLMQEECSYSNIDCTFNISQLTLGQ